MWWLVPAHGRMRNAVLDKLRAADREASGLIPVDQVGLRVEHERTRRLGDDLIDKPSPVSYTHLTLPTTPYV